MKFEENQTKNFSNHHKHTSDVKFCTRKQDRFNFKDLNKKAPKLIYKDDSTRPVVDFAHHKWDIIRDMGNNNYLIAMTNRIDDVRFSRGNYFFRYNVDSLDGYQESTIKLIINQWYDNNISGTPYENYVLPITTCNAKLGDMKREGILGSNIYTLLDSCIFWNRINKPFAYPI